MEPDNDEEMQQISEELHAFMSEAPVPPSSSAVQSYSHHPPEDFFFNPTSSHGENLTQSGSFQQLGYYEYPPYQYAMEPMPSYQTSTPAYVNSNHVNSFQPRFENSHQPASLPPTTMLPVASHSQTPQHSASLYSGNYNQNSNFNQLCHGYQNFPQQPNTYRHPMETASYHEAVTPMNVNAWSPPQPQFGNSNQQVSSLPSTSRFMHQQQVNLQQTPHYPRFTHGLSWQQTQHSNNFSAQSTPHYQDLTPLNPNYQQAYLGQYHQNPILSSHFDQRAQSCQVSAMTNVRQTSFEMIPHSMQSSLTQNVDHNTLVHQPAGGVANINAPLHGNPNFYAAGHDIYNHFQINPLANKEDFLSGNDCSRIQNLLLEAAKEQCKSKSYLKLTQQQIEICQLEITDKPSKVKHPPQKRRRTVNAPQYTDEDGHYNRNKDYEKIDLKQDSKILVEQLFAKAEERANDQGQSQFANIVALIGQPGIGKTTLSKEITKKAISCEMQSIKKVEFCFYISIRRIDFQTASTFVSFLLKNSLTPDSYSKSPVTQNNEKSFLQIVLNSEHVLITMDGLDEAATDCSIGYTYVDLFMENNPLQYIYGLMRGDLLRNAKKIFTSRQKHFFSIDADNRPLFVAEVMGLNEKSQEMLCNQICKDNGTQVWNVIKSNPNFMYSCYVPAKCIFIAFVIWKSLKEGGDGRFHSLTHVFANGFKYYFKQDFVRGETTESEKQEYSNKIAKLAWNGFKNRKTVFVIDDLAAVGIDHQALSGLLATFVTEENWNMKFICSEIMSNFSHLIWQEYFAACYLVFFLPADEFTKLLHQLKTPRWEVVAKFVFGLCCEKVNAVAKLCFCNTVCQEFSTKKASLKGYLVGQLEKAKGKGKSILRICSWLHEIDDETIYTAVKDLFPETLTLSGNILPTDAYSIGHVFSKSEKSYYIEVSRSCKFYHGCFKILLNNLNKQIKAISMQDQVTNEVLTDLANQSAVIQDVLSIQGRQNPVKRLSKRFRSIGLSKLPGSHNGFLTKFIRNFKSSKKLPSLLLKGFLISDNYGELESALAVASCVNLTKSLSFLDCTVPGHVINKISNAVSQLQEPLTSLNLDKTQIDDEGASAIASCLHMIKKLSLSACNISGPGIFEILSQLLMHKKTKFLDITGNCFFKGAMQLCLDKMIPKDLNHLLVTKFHLSESGIRSSGILDLIPWIEKNQKIPVNLREELFEIESIPSKMEVCGDLEAGALSCVMDLFPPTLELKMTSVSNFGIAKIASRNKLKKLNLSHNWIGDSGAASVAGCIHNIEKEVNLSGCHIEDGGVKILCEKIRDLQKPLKKLNLSHNRIGDSGAASVAGCIHNIEEEVDLSGCNIKDGGVKILCEKIRDLQKPLKKLYLSGNKIGNSGAASVAGCIHNIEEEVDLRGCGIEDGGVKILCEKIRNLQKTMKFLDLSLNNLTDESAESLASCVHNIEKLNVDDCDFTQAEMDLITSKSRGEVVFLL